MVVVAQPTKKTKPPTQQLKKSEKIGLKFGGSKLESELTAGLRRARYVEFPNPDLGGVVSRRMLRTARFRVVER